MDHKEFEYNYYFNQYKKTPVLGHQKFKREFKKKHPNVNIDLDKMIIEIEKYQINKYGSISFSSYYIEDTDRDKERQRTWHRNHQRYGTREERNRRKRNSE